jgi:hypothetical protein
MNIVNYRIYLAPLYSILIRYTSSTRSRIVVPVEGTIRTYDVNITSCYILVVPILTTNTLRLLELYIIQDFQDQVYVTLVCMHIFRRNLYRETGEVFVLKTSVKCSMFR